MWNDLKIQFNLNEYFVKAWNGEAIAITPFVGNLYEMKYTKVHRADMTNLVHSST